MIVLQEMINILIFIYTIVSKQCPTVIESQNTATISPNPDPERRTVGEGGSPFTGATIVRT